MERDAMSVSDVIKKAISESEKQVKEVAAHMGWSPQSFANRLRNNTVDADEWVEIARFLGYDVQMVHAENKTVIDDEPKKLPIGPKTVQMVGKVIYDTSKAEPICHTSKFAGGYFELFVDKNGRYFNVFHASWLDGGVIMPIAKEHVAEFIDTCNKTDL